MIFPKKIKVLFIGNAPVPPFDGGNIHLYNILKFLGDKIDSYLVYFVKYDDNRNHSEIMKNLGLNLKFAHCVRAKLKYGIYQRMKGLFSRYPYINYIKTALGKDLLNSVIDILRNYKVDIIHLWIVSFAYSLKNISGVPKILTAGDAFSLMHESLAKTCFFPINIYHQRLAKQFLRYEKEIYPLYNAVVFFSQRDKDRANLPKSVLQSVIPNGVDVNIFTPRIPRQNTYVHKIIFHGNFEGTN